ncbi:MAG: hypothetical protein JNL58_00165 [Planctomyces sp.]|nr:hypothetical protein [Planctomyces sp.]
MTKRVMPHDLKSPRYRQFEEVITRRDDFATFRPIEAQLPSDGLVGTVLWCEKYYAHRDDGLNDFLYVVYFPAYACYATIAERDLASTALMLDEREFPGRSFEISFDTEVDATDIPIAEGSFRLPERFWSVFVIQQAEVSSTTVKRGFARSGIEELLCLIPRDKPITRDLVMKVLGQAVGTDEWVEVAGPDSLVLK